VSSFFLSAAYCTCSRKTSVLACSMSVGYP
jgi:hypothetical protein